MRLTRGKTKSDQKSSPGTKKFWGGLFVVLNLGNDQSHRYRGKMKIRANHQEGASGDGPTGEGKKGGEERQFCLRLGGVMTGGTLSDVNSSRRKETASQLPTVGERKRRRGAHRCGDWDNSGNRGVPIRIAPSSEAVLPKPLASKGKIAPRAVSRRKLETKGKPRQKARLEITGNRKQKGLSNGK